jgi:hypothetical protein
MKKSKLDFSLSHSDRSQKRPSVRQRRPNPGAVTRWLYGLRQDEDPSQAKRIPNDLAVLMVRWIETGAEPTPSSCRRFRPVSEYPGEDLALESNSGCCKPSRLLKVSGQRSAAHDGYRPPLPYSPNRARPLNPRMPKPLRVQPRVRSPPVEHELARGTPTTPLSNMDWTPGGIFGFFD